jgi:hypothetical protein
MIKIVIKITKENIILIKSTIDSKAIIKLKKVLVCVSMKKQVWF